jgi:acetamidase/formamidase
MRGAASGPLRASADFPDPYIRVFDLSNGEVAQLRDDIAIPVEPFFGRMGVCPAARCYHLRYSRRGAAKERSATFASASAKLSPSTALVVRAGLDRPNGNAATLSE